MKPTGVHIEALLAGCRASAVPNIRAGSLRAGSTAGGGGLDLRAIARASGGGGGGGGSAISAAAGSSSPGESRSSSNGSAASREDARNAVANYMEVRFSTQLTPGFKPLLESPSCLCCSWCPQTRSPTTWRCAVRHSSCQMLSCRRCQ